MISPIFLGDIKNGKLKLQRPDRFDNYLLTLDGLPVEVVISKIKKPRSRKENRYYWGVVIILLCDVTGYSDEEMHEALKIKFLMDNSRAIPTVKSTALLTTIEFENYLDKIRLWAAQELSCIIPSPNEVDF